MSNQLNKYQKKAAKKAANGRGGQKRFLINAAVLAGACLLLIFRMPSWGIAQVVVLVLLALIAIFQLVLYFKLR
ncbi:MAG: hypothetical protein E7490_00765 [Ruminococcaceae bacterium]|nr:hypothetical protein [Oscillospiraceae bacterium]